MIYRAALLAFLLLGGAFAAEPDSTCAAFTTSDLRQDCYVRFIANRLEAQHQQDISNGFLEAFKPFSVILTFAVGLWAGRSVG